MLILLGLVVQAFVKTVLVLALVSGYCRIKVIDKRNHWYNHVILIVQRYKLGGGYPGMEVVRMIAKHTTQILGKETP